MVANTGSNLFPRFQKISVACRPWTRKTPPSGTVLIAKENSTRGAIMKIRPNSKGISSRWVATGAAIALASAAALVPAFYAGKKAEPQEKEASRAATAEQTTTLNDQTDLAVTVYNSNIALIRDVRQLQLPSGGFRLKFMDIAATVNPATVHFRSLTDPEKLDVIEQNYEYDLLEPAK